MFSRGIIQVKFCYHHLVLWCWCSSILQVLQHSPTYNIKIVGVLLINIHFGINNSLGNSSKLISDFIRLCYFSLHRWQHCNAGIFERLCGILCVATRIYEEINSMWNSIFFVSVKYFLKSVGHATEGITLIWCNKVRKWIPKKIKDDGKPAIWNTGITENTKEYLK